MRVFRNISIRLKFIILALIVIGFSIFSILTFLHTENTIQDYRQLEMTFEEYFDGLHDIDNKLMHLVYFSSEDTLANQAPGELALFVESVDHFSQSIDELKKFALIEEDSSIQNQLSEIQSIAMGLRKNITINSLPRISSLPGVKVLISSPLPMVFRYRILDSCSSR